MHGKYLLLHDVEHLGRSGDLVTVKPGYARNFLLPRRFVAIADRATLRLREKLQRERAERAAEDLAASQKLAQQLNTLALTTEVKVDQEGHMYGSVGSNDVVAMLSENGISLDRRSLLNFRSLKNIGEHIVKIKLKENVIAQVRIEITAEGQVGQTPKSTEDQEPHSKDGDNSSDK